MSKTSPRLADRDLSRVWPKVALALYRTLRRRGASHETAEDVVQEVGCKIVAKLVPFESADDLLRFAHHAARCLWIDRLRASRRRRDAMPTRARVHSPDLADTVIDRLMALAAWSELSSADQAILMNTASAPADRQDYVRRHRARERVERALTGLGAAFAWGRLRLPRTRTALAPATVAIACGSAAMFFSHASAPVNRTGAAPSAPALAAGVVVQHVAVQPVHRVDLVVPPRPRASTKSPTRPDAYSVPRARVIVGPAKSRLADAGTRDSTEDDPIVCLRNLPMVGTSCAGRASDVPSLINDERHR